MYVSKVHHRRTVFGLRWIAPFKDSESGKKIKLLRSIGLGRNNPVYGVKSVGKSTGIYGKRKIKKGVSAAAWLALSKPEKSILLIASIGDDKQWFCAVHRGDVIPGGDIVANRDAMASQSKVFYDSFPDAEIINNVDVADLSDILDAGKADQAAISEITWIKVKQAIVGGLSTFFVVAAIYMVWPKPEHVEQPIVRAEHIDPRTQAVTVLQSKPSLENVVTICMNILRNEPRFVGGWQLSSLSYAKKRIRMTWKRKYAKNTKLLFKHAPHAVLSFNGDTAIMDGAVHIPVQSNIIMYSVNRFIMEMLAIKMNIKNHESVLKYTTPEKNSTITSIKNIMNKIHWKTGKWSLKGSGLQSLKQDGHQMRNGGVIFVDSLIIKLGNKITWSAEGHYVIKG